MEERNGKRSRGMMEERERKARRRINRMEMLIKKMTAEQIRCRKIKNKSDIETQ